MNNGNRNLRELFISQSLKTCSDYYQTPKFRLFSHRIKNKNKKSNIFSSILKSKTINKIKCKNFFDSLHKSLIHKKLSSNPKYIEIEKRICNTERIMTEKEKKYFDMDIVKKKILKKNIERIFLTNNNERPNNTINKIKKHVKIMTINNTRNKSSYKNLTLNVQSNIFLPFDIKRFRNNDYPNVYYPKIKDFIEDIKMIRTVKFINDIKTEQHKQRSACVGLETEKIDMTMYSLTNSIKLLNSYNSSFTNYNKFLINEIKKEKKILNEIIINENIIKEQVLLLQKKFDDLMLELEILTNFSNLFNAIKNRTKIQANNITNKSFAEITIEKLKQKIFLNQKNKFISSKHISPKRNLIKKKIRESKFNESHIKLLKSNKDINKSEKNEKTPEKIIDRKSRKYQTILNIKNHSHLKREKRKTERLNSFQPSSISKKSTIDTFKQTNSLTYKVKLDNYDIQKELRAIVNNILNLMEQYNDIEGYIVYYKLLFEKQTNSIDELKRNQKRKENINNLNYNKNYNLLLIAKYKLLKSQNNDYSLIFFIYHKVNEIIDEIKDYKIKKYQNILDNIVSIYDKNKLYNQYKNEKNKNESLKAYLEKEIINYLYKMFIWIERLVYDLIEGKNTYLTSNYYWEQIEKFESKRDNAKKIFNNRFKKNEEILRREKIQTNTIKKLNKIRYKPFRKVVQNYQILKNTHKKEIQKLGNEDDNLLFD